jgi:hypothetical protein
VKGDNVVGKRIVSFLKLDLDRLSGLRAICPPS